MSEYNTSRTQSASANFKKVNLSTSQVTLIEKNDNREDLLIFNDSDRTMFVSFTGTISADEFSFKILPQGYYETGITTFTGKVVAAWDAAQSGGTGRALVTELEV